LVLIKILCFCALKMTDSFSKNLWESPHVLKRKL
jgi:hypothetical protein